MIRAVLDTNVLVSALLSPSGAPAKVLNHVILGNVTICYDSNIIAEYEDVLSRPKFKFDLKLVNQVLNYLIHTGISVIPQPSDEEFEDEDDRVFYEVALSTKANLVTENTKHFPYNKIIVTPQEFLLLIERNIK